MGKRMVVNVGITETRVALTDNGLLTELYVERRRQRSIVGNVYRGVVTNVLPGMQAAFVDIGLNKDAFLYGGDYTENLAEYERLMLGETEDEDIEVDEVERPRETRLPIEDLLCKGQEVLVQVAKEPLGTKGARVTSFVSLPGRSLVFMPQAQHVGVSRRIRDEQERHRLRSLVKSMRPPAGGFIIRTVAEGKGEEEFASDVQFLVRLWSEIQRRYEQASAPSCLHEEMDLIFRVVRDLFSPEVEEFLIDDEAAYQKCLEFTSSLVPSLSDRVKHYESSRPIFEALGIEKEIEKALRRRVWLKSGGTIVIDQTEALVSIDVNTGKYVGKRDFEQTILKINLEAVNEIVRQIRLRDLGGIIILDFIDMEREDHKQQVSRALKKALAEDKARTNVLEISPLGLVEMTRKRVRQTLQSLFCAPCPICKGTGVVKSESTVAAEIFRKVQAAAATGGQKEIVVRVHPQMAQSLESEERDALELLEQRTGRKLTIQSVLSFDREEYEIISR